MASVQSLLREAADMADEMDREIQGLQDDLVDAQGELDDLAQSHQFMCQRVRLLEKELGELRAAATP